MVIRQMYINLLITRNEGALDVLDIIVLIEK